MRLNKQTIYAIRILTHCARSDGLVKVADISAKSGITPQNAIKIAHLLVRAGFLQAFRGRNGGIKLSRPARDIGVGEVVRAMERSLLDASGAPAADEAAAIGRVFDQAFEAFAAVLDQHTLEDMAGGTETRGAGKGGARRSLAATHSAPKR